MQGCILMGLRLGASHDGFFLSSNVNQTDWSTLKENQPM